MRIRIKEIQKARKRQEARWKAAHKGAVTGSSAPAAPAPAARPAAGGGASRPARPAGGSGGARERRAAAEG